MSNFPKVHGLKLAKNAYIENLGIERLDTDPLDITVAGHVWFNNTDKRFKCTALDTDGTSIVIKGFATLDELTSAVEGNVISVFDEGVEVSSGVTKFNFVGANVQAMSDDGKEVTVYLPPPSFTSHWNTNDGTVGTNIIPDVSTVTRNVSSPSTEGNPFKIGDWTAGTAHSVVTAASLTYTSPNQVCFDNLTSSFIAQVLDADGTTALATCQLTNISGNATHTTQNITVTLTGWTAQYNKYKANVSVAIGLSSILPAGGRFSVSLRHISTVTYTKTQNNLFYDNSTVQPSLSTVSITPATLNSTKYLSGVRYYDKTDTFTINVTGIDNTNQLSYPTNLVQVETNNSYGITDFALANTDLSSWTTLYSNTGSSYTGLKSITRNNFRRNTGTTISTYPLDNSSGRIYSSSVNLLVDTYTSSSTDINEDFVDESKRLTATWTSWNSTALLSTSDLMVHAGTLRRQTGNWTSYLPSNTADYSGTNTITQYYYRQFRHANISHSNGIFNITGCTQTDLNNSNVRVWISLDSVNWYLCNALYAGGVLTNGSGCRINTDTRPLPQLEFTLGTGGSTSASSGPSGWGIYVTIEMPSGSSVQLTNLDITNWT